MMFKLPDNLILNDRIQLSRYFATITIYQRNFSSFSSLSPTISTLSSSLSRKFPHVHSFSPGKKIFSPSPVSKTDQLTH